MKIDFKIDYIAKTAAHFTTMKLTPYSASTVEKNRTHFLDVAERAKNNIAAEATRKARESLPSGRVDLVV
ncbi:MAG: hypothetical protein H8E41_03115 [Desulfobulbaceae bacterium]|uniref:Uncharacterized protein n=1 Tax=Candidatus Desulfobia pelagia TaxID=2841692 RepID=A0A8J6TE91_9BACT|nr:hypothetical protein [Candidatus Desulfobia pelagia]